MRIGLAAVVVAALLIAGPFAATPSLAQPAEANSVAAQSGWSTPAVLLFTTTAVVAALAVDIYTGGALTTPLARAGTWLMETVAVRAPMGGRAAVAAPGVAGLAPAMTEGAAPAAVQADVVTAPGLGGLAPTVAETAPAEAAVAARQGGYGPGRMQMQGSGGQRPGCYQVTMCGPRIRPVDPESVPELMPPAGR